MLIVDFVFGGETYANDSDILDEVGEHTICFTFVFNEEKYYFSRNIISKNVVNKCNEKYEILDTIPIAEFTEWLKKQYGIRVPNLSFRDAVGRYIRVYGKDNCLEKQPLAAARGEKDIKAITALLKLFNYYDVIEKLEQQAKASKELYTTFKNAQKLQFIAQINKTQYKKNLEEIKKLKEEVENLSSGLEKGLLDVDSAASEEAISLKKSLSRARRYRSSILSKLSTIDENETYRFSASSDSFDELKKFFPDIDVEQLSHVENFHKKIAGVFKKELREEKAKLLKELEEYNSIIGGLENRLKELVENPNLSKIVLSKHAEMLKELDRMQRENEAFLKINKLKETKSDDEERYESIKQKQTALLANALNIKMKEINDHVYSSNFNSPVISFKENTYSFFTPKDTGTGMAYKGLVVFDLSVLSLTDLPLLVHDSVVLKQISDEAIERIMELYCASNKQVIIALDKQNSYGKKTEKVLEENAVLHLSPDTGALFGRSWGKN